MKKSDSRGPLVDTQKCVQNVDHNRFNLVLIASERLRELRRKNSNPENYPSSVDALLDVQEGKVNPKVYLSKVGTKKTKS